MVSEQSQYAFHTGDLCYLVDEYHYPFINNIFTWICISLGGLVELAKHFMLFSIKSWHVPWDQQGPGYLESCKIPPPPSYFFSNNTCLALDIPPACPRCSWQQFVSRGTTAGGSNNLSLRQLEVLQQLSRFLRIIELLTKPAQW